MRCRGGDVSNVLILPLNLIHAERYFFALRS